MHHAEVSVVLDSISPAGIRLTTYQLRYWRPIHSELMTHRDFSRSAGSSRARPSQAIIDQVNNDPWGPVHWGKNQPGMQATEELGQADKQDCINEWVESAKSAATHAEWMESYGAHKQVVNRILEPYTYIDVVVSSTRYNNWFALRNHKDADPTIQDLAQRMYDEREASYPTRLMEGEWHLPYIREEDWIEAFKYLKEGRVIRSEPSGKEVDDLLVKVSAARCARVSYKAFNGKVATIQEDLDLYNKLITSELVHASPTEHQAYPDKQIGSRCVDKNTQTKENPWGDEVPIWENPNLQGNYHGWVQHRKLIPNEYVPG